jgi:hypothetical protein
MEKHTLVVAVVELGMVVILIMLVLVELAVAVEEVMRIIVLLQLMVQDPELLTQEVAAEVVERKVAVVEIEQHMLLVGQEL